MINISDKSLQKLSAEHPEIWRDVIGTLRGHVEKRQIDRLGELALKANSVIARWMSATSSPLAETQHARSEVIKAQMTRLAIEQFLAAYSGTAGALTWRDHLLISSILWLAAERGIVTTERRFDRLWSLVTNKAAAAALIQKNGHWSIPTEEVCEKITALAGDHEILEIGSGRGLYLAGLRAAGARVQGIDDHSWPDARKPLKRARPFIRIQSADEALIQAQPTFVLCVWPTPQNTFERQIFRTKSVRTYIAVVSENRFASGDWNAYKDSATSGGFTCAVAPEANAMLRPVEMDQQFLIFRRKT